MEGICAQCGGAYHTITCSQFCGLECWREFASTEYRAGVRPCAVCDVPVESDHISRLKCDDCVALSHFKPEGGKR